MKASYTQHTFFSSEDAEIIKATIHTGRKVTEMVNILIFVFLFEPQK